MARRRTKEVFNPNAWYRIDNTAIALACALVVALMSGSAQAMAEGSVMNAQVQPGHSATFSLVVSGVVRSYRLHLPTHYSGRVAVPLVLAFHGHGSSAVSFERVTGFSREADAHGFIVVYPQGAIGPDGQTGWNTGRAGKDPMTDDVGFVDALVSHLQVTLYIDSSRIYATGFSNGGGFTAILACERAALFAAVGIDAGDYYPQPGGCHPSRAIPLLEIHGAADTIIPYQGSAALHYPPVRSWLDAWAARDGCTTMRAIALSGRRAGATVIQWSGCSRGVMILHYALRGVAHIWPTGNRASDYFSATSAIRAFFAL